MSVGLLAFVRFSVACSSDDSNNPTTTPTPTQDAQPDTTPFVPSDSGPFNPQDTSVPPQCDGTKDYGAPVAMPGPKEIFSARFVKNEGLIFVTASCGPACATGSDVFTTIVKDGGLDNFLPVASGSTAGNDESATLTTDGKTMIVATASTTDAAAYRHLARYVDPGTGTFALESPVLVADTPEADDVQPYMLPDQTLYFASNRLVRNETYQVFRAAHNAQGGYDAPAKIDAINVGGTDQQYPVATADESVIYFSSPRAPTLGGLDIWRVVKDGTGAYGAAEHVQAFSSDKRDFVTYISPDACHLYFLSDREGGSLKLFKASKPK